MKTVALLSGGDWADADVDLLDIPEDMDIEAVKKEWREWYNTTYVPALKSQGVKFKTVVDLMIEKGAKRSDIEEFEV